MNRYGASRQRGGRQSGLRLARGVQLKYFLRYQNLAAGMGESRAEVIRRILNYVDSGKLSGETVDRAIVEFLEYRNKRVYLHTAEPSRLSRLDLSRFTRGIKDWSDARIIPTPEAPRENYAYVDADGIRVTFSETHRHPAVHVASERVGWRRVGKVIVLDADRGTGFVTLSLDAPGRIHPHGSRPWEYYEHYQRRAEALLGATLTPFPLQRALQRLEAGDLVRLQQGRGSTVDGRIDITAAGPDVRAMPAFQAVKPNIAVRDSGRYVWVTGEPLTQGVALLREVPTEIHARTSMVRFTRDSLVQEVRYVLGQIQAHS